MTQQCIVPRNQEIISKFLIHVYTKGMKYGVRMHRYLTIYHIRGYSLIVYEINVCVNAVSVLNALPTKTNVNTSVCSWWNWRKDSTYHTKKKLTPAITESMRDWNRRTVMTPKTRRIIPTVMETAVKQKKRKNILNNQF